MKVYIKITPEGAVEIKELIKSAEETRKFYEKMLETKKKKNKK